MDFLIKEAILKSLEEEFNSIPPVEELEKMYTFSERHTKIMQEIFAELRRRERLEAYFYTIKKIAIIILIVLALAVASVKFVPKVYAYVREWLMEFADDNSIEFRGKNSDARSEERKDLRFELGYVPEGYELESEEYQKSGVYKATYKHYDGEKLKFRYCNELDGSMFAIDIIGILIDEESINGIQYYIFEHDDEEIIIVWGFKENLFMLVGCIDKSEMLNIAINIKTKE